MMVDPKIIVALDYSNPKLALELVDQLDSEFCRLKVGITMFTQQGPAFIEKLMSAGFEIFLDLKFHDIPHQVAGACRSAAELGVWMLTIHTLGGKEMCEAAANAVANFEKRPHIVGVTVLTSSGEKELKSINIEQPVETVVSNLTNLANHSGLDGIVCSALEVSSLRQQVGKDFLLVTPGIRLEGDRHGDQKRIMTPERAIEAGADYLVIGRPITEANNLFSVVARLKSINSKP